MSVNTTAAALVACIAAAGLVSSSAAAAEADAAAGNAEIAALKAEVEQLRGMLPSQSHAMADVDYQFANLLFASARHNWPLATFYRNETRSHIGWTVKLRPIRKLASGQDLDLRPLQQAIEQSGLTQIRAALDKHDNKAFEAAYRATMGQCHACHVASEKPFLLPRIPDSPATRMIDMQPGR